MKIDVIIPTYKPGKEFGKLIGRLQKQEYPIHKIIIINPMIPALIDLLNASEPSWALTTL